MAHAGGRPTDYKKEYCEKAIELLKEGYAKVEIAAEFGVSRMTLDTWTKIYPEFFDAINTGLDFSESWWTKQARENLSSKDFNSRLYEINMMNRFGWMKKSEGKQEITIKPEDALKELK